jgi:hypothetical protein
LFVEDSKRLREEFKVKKNKACYICVDGLRVPTWEYVLWLEDQLMKLLS